MKKYVVAAIAVVLLLAACTQQTAEKRIVSSEEAPKAIGPYSQAVLKGGTLYLSGQLGMDPAAGTFAGEDFETQARQALKNQKAVLAEAGFSLADVVQCQVFVTDLDNYAAFNTIYQEFFTREYPARAVVEVSRLPAGGLVEIMMTAEK